jgi:hypothetical protein
MMTKSFGLFFHLKKQRRVSKGVLPIYLRITVNCVPKELSIHRVWDSEKWNLKTGRAIGATEQVRTLNAFLDTVQAKAFEAKHRLIENGIPISSQGIKNILLGYEPSRELPHYLIEIFKYHNEQVKALIGTEYSSGTLIKFQTMLKHTRDFLKDKYRIEDIEIRKLDYDFVAEMEFWFSEIPKNFPPCGCPPMKGKKSFCTITIILKRDNKVISCMNLHTLY